ncbi:hypothetical protein FRC12_024411 [Ceratobasidium sp. 428]|nr:hypothetical protein FRC12_024411 [Ceratobasidium sp. 428]
MNAILHEDQQDDLRFDFAMWHTTVRSVWMRLHDARGESPLDFVQVTNTLPVAKMSRTSTITAAKRVARKAGEAFRTLHDGFQGKTTVKIDSSNNVPKSKQVFSIVAFPERITEYTPYRDAMTYCSVPPRQRFTVA